MTRFSIPFLTLCLAFLLVQDTSSVTFNREVTGVVFSQYVKRRENGVIPPWTSYKLEDVVTMMRIVATKFKRTATYGVGADNVEYGPDLYNKSNAAVFAAEAAAIVNQEHKNLSLTILIGIWQGDNDVQMNSEAQLALETAQRANAIFPGTAVGIVFSHWQVEETRALQTLEQIQLFKDRIHGLGLKVGARQQCNSGSRQLKEIRRKIVNESDFIICEVNPALHNMLAGPKTGIITVRDDLRVLSKEFKKINPNIEVMGQTGWASKGQKWEHPENLKGYWEVVNQWAIESNYTMWMFEAFDCPWKADNPEKPNDAYFGWWKLRRNADIDKMEGYAEKIYEPPEVEGGGTAGTSPWVYAGATFGGLFLVVVFGLFGLLYIRVNKLQQAVTNEDIKEFMYGMSDETAAASGGQVENALKFPYDKSFEISKELLNIRKDALLGTGQFGCVYRALVEKQEESTEVALKMTKPDCPKTAMKGILSEIKILTYLGKHPNIVCIFGAYTAELKRGVVYVATELCPLGSLEEYLRKGQSGNTPSQGTDRYANAPASAPISYENDNSISYMDMVRWSHEIACGMEYLGTKHVVHADLATRNVLLALDKTAKITDFGLSRRLYDYTNYVKQQQEPLPWRWMAIESLKKLEFSAMSDVWSYGVTLWEIFAMGDLPYPGLSWNLEFVDDLVNGLRMKSPPHATPEMYEIMTSCWHNDPMARSTFTDLKMRTGNLIPSSVAVSNESYTNVV